MHTDVYDRFVDKFVEVTKVICSSLLLRSCPLTLSPKPFLSLPSTPYLPLPSLPPADV